MYPKRFMSLSQTGHGRSCNDQLNSPQSDLVTSSDPPDAHPAIGEDTVPVYLPLCLPIRFLFFS